MHTFLSWEEFRLPIHPPCIPNRRSGLRKNEPEEFTLERRIPTDFKVIQLQPIMACEPDTGYDHPDEAFHKARRFHLEHQDFREAEKWYRIAAIENHPDACFHLGFLFETHFRDLTEARLFYQKAIDAGNSYACNNLALLLWSESGPGQEVEKLLKQSLASNNKLSAGALVLYYEAIGNMLDLKQTARIFLSHLSEEDTHNRALGIVLDCLIRQKEFTFLRSQFLKPGSVLMKKAQPYWHVLEIIRKANIEDDPIS
jgi:hypothetical protein